MPSLFPISQERRPPATGTVCYNRRQPQATVTFRTHYYTSLFDKRRHETGRLPHVNCQATYSWYRPVTLPGGRKRIGIFSGDRTCQTKSRDVSNQLFKPSPPVPSLSFPDCSMSLSLSESKDRATSTACLRVSARRANLARDMMLHVFCVS